MSGFKKEEGGGGAQSSFFFFFFFFFLRTMWNVEGKLGGKSISREYIINVPFTRLSGGPIGIHYITGINNIHEWISNEIVA